MEFLGGKSRAGMIVGSISTSGWGGSFGAQRTSTTKVQVTADLVKQVIMAAKEEKKYFKEKIEGLKEFNWIG